MLFGLTFVIHHQIFTVRALYLFFICLYYLVARVLSVRNKKAAAWINGRKMIFPYLKERIGSGDKIIWLHCSSAGEFEQAKPLIECLKMEFPSHKILVSFYSPSGYSVAKNDTIADIFCYLPLDTPWNAKKFLTVVNPSLVIFVKYDYWYFHLKEIRQRNIPLLLASAVFRENQPFFKWYGTFFRNILDLFSWIFVQDDQSERLLKKNKLHNCSIAGDTRFDRVSRITTFTDEVPLINDFINDQPCIVAGSTWEDDELFLSRTKLGKLKIILAPHIISEAHISHIRELFRKPPYILIIPRNMIRRYLLLIM